MSRKRRSGRIPLIVVQLAFAGVMTWPAKADTLGGLDLFATQLHAETSMLGSATGDSHITGQFSHNFRPGLQAKILGRASTRRNSSRIPSRRIECQLGLDFEPTAAEHRLWLTGAVGRSLRTEQSLSFAALSAGAEFALGSALLWLQTTTTRFEGLQALTPVDSLTGVYGDSLIDYPVLAQSSSSTRSIHDNYTHAEIGLTWGRGRIELDGLVGMRLHGGTTGESWAQFQGTYWLSDRFAFVGRVGLEPSIPEQDLPSRDVAALALRVNLFGTAAQTSPQHHPISPLDVPPVIDSTPAFEAVPKGDGRYEFRLRCPSAERVEIAGDFNDWQPSSMISSTGGIWFHETTLAPGNCRISVRINGGEWSAPPGLTSQEDEFGRAVGCFLVG